MPLITIVQPNLVAAFYTFVVSCGYCHVARGACNTITAQPNTA